TMEGRMGLLFLVVLGAAWACDARELANPDLLSKLSRKPDACALCEEYSTKVLDYLNENKTQQEIIDILLNTCHQTSSFKQKCITLVDYYAPLFFLEIVTIQPGEFCHKVNLCQLVTYISLLVQEDTSGFCKVTVSTLLAKLKDSDTKGHVWSCGVMLYVLLAGHLPFQDTNLMEMYRKIGRGEFKFPKWFAPDVRRFLSRILDPNPKARISMAKIMESSWFKKGLEKPAITVTKNEELAPLDADGIFEACENDGPIAEPKQEQAKPCNLNAFDIISFSTGFDLPGLFEDTFLKKETRFMSKKPASIIVLKLEEICKQLCLKVKKKDRGLLKLEGSKEGRKGTLGVDAEIFEITPHFHMVELRKSNGDTMEYQKLFKQDIRPALKDIVWTWQGEKPQQEQQQHEVVQEEHQPSHNA
ncbi:CBL-interacting serine/threonine-protein kinase 10, partial [Glycine soja]